MSRYGNERSSSRYRKSPEPVQKDLKKIIFEVLKEILTEVFKVEPEKIKLETKFSDIWAEDNGEYIFFLLAVEDEFQIEIFDEQAEEMQTVKDLVEVVEKNGSENQTDYRIFCSVRKIISEMINLDEFEINLSGGVVQPELKGLFPEINDQVTTSEIISRVAEKFKIKIPDEQAKKISSVRDLVKAVETATAQDASGFSFYGKIEK